MSSDPQHQLRPPFFFFCHERTGDALTRRRVPEKKVGRRFIRIQLSAPYFLRRIHNTVQGTLQPWRQIHGEFSRDV